METHQAPPPSLHEVSPVSPHRYYTQVMRRQGIGSRNSGNVARHTPDHTHPDVRKIEVSCQELGLSAEPLTN